MSLNVQFSRADRRQSKRGDAQNCLIATAARRQWGGDWSVSTLGAQHTASDGHVTQYALSPAGKAAVSLFDAGLPVPVHRVKLTKLSTRRLRTAVTVAAAVAVWMLAEAGLAWVVFAVLGLVAAGIIAVAAVTLRGAHRPAGGRAEHPAAHMAGPMAARPSPASAPLPVPAPVPEQAAAPAVARELVLTRGDTNS